MRLQRIDSFLRKFNYSLRRLFLRQFMIAHSKQLGLQFKFKAEDVVGRHIYKYDVHELETTNILLDKIQINKDDIVLDIGANIGWYALLFAKFGAFVHAFEPDPLNHQLLCENIIANQVTGTIRAHQLAVSDKKTIMPLYLNPDSNRGRHSLNPNIGRDTVDVSVISLDDYLDAVSVDTSKIKCIKIDVEGHEYPALKGAEKLLKHVPYLLVEYGPEHIRKGGYDPKDLINLLDSYDYTPYTITNEGIQEATLEHLYKEEDEYNIFWQKRAATST